MAIVTALLLTTLAVTIVASLFWQQQVQVRSMENQRLQFQTRWIVRGALSLSKLVLFSDFFTSRGLTTLEGTWATPLEETRLDDYIERERRDNENFNATLSGRLVDAQSRYNLNNLAKGRVINQDELAVFQRLLSNLQQDPNLALVVARQVARAQPRVQARPQSGGSDSSGTGSSGAEGGSGTGMGGGTSTALQAGSGEPLELLRVEDLLAVAGFTPAAVERLRDFVVVLPEPTPLNVNTAPAELLAALSPNLTVSEAAVLVNTRKRTPFNNTSNYKTNPVVAAANRQPQASFDVKSSFFLAYSRVQLDRASLEAVSLLQRSNNGTSTVLWMREN